MPLTLNINNATQIHNSSLSFHEQDMKSIFNKKLLRGDF